MIKRLVLAATVVAAMGATLAPANADVCVTTDITVNGMALPTNGTNCLPEAPPLPELPPPPGL